MYQLYLPDNEGDTISVKLVVNVGICCLVLITKDMKHIDQWSLSNSINWFNVYSIIFNIGI